LKNIVTIVFYWKCDGRPISSTSSLLILIQFSDGVTAASAKLMKLVSQLPVTQKANPIVATLRERAEATPPPSPERVVAVVERLNAMVEDDAALNDVWAILREVQGMTCGDGSAVVIDADKLTTLTLTMLSLYVSSKDD
jgi:hypothetical protein